MTDVKISAMTAAADPDGTEFVETVQSAANVKMTTLQIVKLLLRKASTWVQQQASSVARGSMSGAVSINLAALASSTGVTWSGTPPTSTNKLVLTLIGNVTSIAFTGAADGANYEILFMQDATGSRAMPALPAALKFSNGTAPTFTTTANAIDVLCMDYYSTEGIYVAAFAPKMS